jgi:hypothetical protein
MKCYKCNEELDWVNEYHEVTIRTHTFKELNIEPLKRIFACTRCGIDLNDCYTNKIVKK